MSKVLYESSFSNNALVIFEDVRKMRSGRRLRDDLVHVASSVGRLNYCKYHEVESKDELVAALKAVEIDCRERGMKPILHFEFHGHLEKGLLIEKTGEYMSWLDLMGQVSAINAVTLNNTGVMLASCYGYKLASLVEIDKPCPFHFMVGPVQQIRQGFLGDSLKSFYIDLIKSYDLTLALEALNDEFLHFVCSWWFFSVCAVYMDRIFEGRKGRGEVINDTIDEYKIKYGPPDSATLKSLRKCGKEYLRSPEYFFGTLSRRFMHSEEGLSYEDHRKLADRI